MIHKYRQLGKNIVLDVFSGAVLEVDDLTFDLLDYAERASDELPAQSMSLCGKHGVSAEELSEAWGELAQLKNEGLLFTEDEYAGVAGIMAGAETESYIKALCLHVAHDCNLRCEYCFAAKGDFGTGRKLMDSETAKKAIDFVVARSGARRNIEIDFFGGEPLMAMDTVKSTIEYAKRFEDKNFRFTITTNGVLLDDENIDFINREMGNVVLSMDGRREINDAMRPTPNGRGSYDAIVPKFQKLVKQRDKDRDYYIRGTFTKENLDFSEDILHMAALGFDQLSVEPVVADDFSLTEADRAEVEKYAITEKDLPAIYAEYERLAEEMAKQTPSGEQNSDFNFFHFNIDLEQGPCVIKRLRGCGAGSEYVAITPEGDIYPCHQFVGREEYRLGNVNDPDVFNTEISRQFAALNVYTRPDCAECWAKFYCSGGCNAANLAANGDINRAYKLGCDIERKRVECAIALKLVRGEPTES